MLVTNYKTQGDLHKVVKRLGLNVNTDNYIIFGGHLSILFTIIYSLSSSGFVLIDIVSNKHNQQDVK